MTGREPRARRIVVRGTSGAGKTTVGREVARRLGAPFVEIDALVHGPGWIERSDETVRAEIDAAIGGHERWVVDGNYTRKVGSFVAARAELIVWLDLPLLLKVARIARRSYRRILGNQPLWNDNRETWGAVFAGWYALIPHAIRSHFQHRREWTRHRGPPVLLRLRSAGAVEHWISRITPEGAPTSP